jgi:hypothetical protein
MKNKLNSFLSVTTGILKLPVVIGLLSQNVREQKKYIQKHLLPDLDYFQKNNDDSLKEADFKKITNYYALGVPAVLGYGFSLLRNSPLSTKERSCMTYLGGISGLLDDLFDEPEKEVLHLESFIVAPENLKPINNYESLLKHFYISGLKNSENKSALKEQADKVFNTEKESKLQNSKELSCEEIRELTFLKGGHSFLFYRLCLNNTLEEAEKKMIYQLGGLMQMGNDIFDVWEDVQQGIETLATKSYNITDLRKSFTKELDKAIEAVNNCRYPKKQLETFTRINLLGLSRIYVCLDQFEKLQIISNNIFEPSTYSRDQLICDMEKPENKKAAIKYYLRLHSQYL